MTHLYYHTHVCDSCVALCTAFTCGMTHPCRPWLILVRLDSFILPQMRVDGCCIAIYEAIVRNVTHAYGLWLDSFISTNMPHSRRLWLIHVRHDSLILPLPCVEGFCVAIHEAIACDVTHSYGPWLIHVRQNSDIASHMCTRLWYAVATISRLLKIIGLFCRI